MAAAQVYVVLEPDVAYVLLVVAYVAADRVQKSLYVSYYCTG
jgi:hypothetical protein